MIEEYVDAGELKELLSSLIVVLGLLVIAALFASIVVPGLRNANSPESPTPATPVGGEPGWLDPTEFPPGRGRVIPPVDPKTLIAATPQMVDRGKQLFEKNCTSCHGESGHGDGPAASTMNPRPRDFTSPNSWTNGYNLPAIFGTLSEGVKGTSMASFDYLSKPDRMALAHYVQALGTFPHGSGSAEAMEGLQGKLAAAGERTRNRIPVSMAMKRLIEEYAAPPRLEIPTEDHSLGVEILRRVVNDPSKAAAALRSQSGDAAPVREILDGVPGNGFAVSVATLSASEWQALRSELARIAR